MKVGLSHTFNLGICNITVSKSGLSVSTGALGQRIGINSKGQGSIKLGIPGIPGLSYKKTKKIA